MALYHLSVKVIGRSTGKSAVACAAYRAAERLHDLRESKTHDYTRKGDIEHTEILAPEGAPDWALQRGALWNQVEASEKRKDSQLAREVEVALPRELSAEARTSLVRSFVQEEFISKGMIADVAIHNPKASDGHEQPHAHIMLTMRNLDAWEFGGKNRQWNRDFTDGAKSVDDRIGGFANTQGKGNGFVGKSTCGLVGLRERWADAVNAALEEADSQARVDHRSYQERGIDKEPQPKLGAAVWVKSRLGEIRDQVKELWEVGDRNAIRHSLARIRSGDALAEARRVTRAVHYHAQSLGYDLTRERHLAYGGRIHDHDLEVDR